MRKNLQYSPSTPNDQRYYVQYKLHVLLLHDNAPAHIAGVATSVATNCCLIHHIRQTSNFYLFPLLKEHLHGRQYASNNDIQSVEDFVEVQDELFYQTGIHKLQKRQNKCIEAQGDYVEKLTSYCFYRAY